MLLKYKVINAIVINPKNSMLKAHRKNHAEVEVYGCCNSEHCELYAKGQCTMLGFFYDRCPYSNFEKLTGPTPAAKSYNKFINENKEKYKDVLNALTSTASKVMAKVGDYVYLPYSHLNMNTDLPFKRYESVFVKGDTFLKLSDFNIKNILSIVYFRPHAMMGGEITSYQNEVVPKFVEHLSEKFPELYEELIEKDPDFKITTINHVGRTAVLKTLNPGSIFTKNNETWEWTGTDLISHNYRPLFAIVDFENAVTKLKPTENAAIKVENETQVNENTIYLD